MKVDEVKRSEKERKKAMQYMEGRKKQKRKGKAKKRKKKRKKKNTVE